MFTFAIFIGLYSYLIFALGLMSLLTKPAVIIVTVLWLLAFLFVQRKQLLIVFNKTAMLKPDLKKTYKRPFFWLISLFILQAAVNIIGALGPELAFDALWYHLTLPKLYLLY